MRTSLRFSFISHLVFCWSCGSSSTWKHLPTFCAAGKLFVASSNLKQAAITWASQHILCGCLPFFDTYWKVAIVLIPACSVVEWRWSGDEVPFGQWTCVKVAQSLASTHQACVHLQSHLWRPCGQIWSSPFCWISRESSAGFVFLGDEVMGQNISVSLRRHLYCKSRA